MSDGLIYLLDQAGLSLRQAQQIIAEQAQTIEAQAARIAELESADTGS